MSVDVNKYINSQDIAKYCKSIKHVFNPIEKAVIIATSFLPLRYRLDGYKKLLAEAGDFLFPFKWMESDEIEMYDLSIVLRNIIEYEERILNFVMRTEKDAIFQASVSYGRDEWDNPLYYSFEEALKSIKEEHNDGSCSCKIEKRIVGSELAGVANVCPDGTILSAYSNLESNCDICSELDLINGKSIYSIPTPFQPGDILEMHDGNKHTICVLKSLHQEISPNNSKTPPELNTITDMYAKVYRMDHDKLIEDTISPYINLCYSNGEIPINQQALKLVSQHLKGKLDIVELLDYLNIIWHSNALKRHSIKANKQ